MCSDVNENVKRQQHAKRFSNADDATIDELNTKKSKRYAVKMLYDYCSSKGCDTEFEGKTATVLNNVLNKCYLNVRRANGEYYNRSSLLVIH